MIHVRGGTVVDADGAREGSLTVENGQIVAVDAPGSEGPEDPATELAVDGYVAPGLVDAHVHVSMAGRPDPESKRSESDQLVALRANEHLRDALHAGVTTIRDLGARGTLAIDAGDAVEQGIIEGPRVLAAGQAVTMTGGHGNWFGREADGPLEVRKAAREQLKRGADVLKCMATGGVLTEGAVTGAPELTQREIEALVDAGRAKNVPTAAHAHGAAGIKNATRAGISSVEHGTFMDREAAEMMADAGTYWVPTASALHGIVDNGVEAGIPDWAVEKAEEAADSFDDAFDHAIEAGVSIAMGTDAGTPFNHHADIPTEMELLVDHGLDAETALEAATVNAADLLGLDDVGLVREGYRADLVVLDSDPREDPTAWQDPEHVIAGGELVY